MKPAPGRIEFHDLSIGREDGGSCVVGRIECGDFVAIPAIGVRVIEILRRGRSIPEAEALLQASGHAIDVGDFVQTMREMGFVRAVDGVVCEDAAPRGWRPPARLVPALRVLHGRAADALIAAYAVSAGVLAWRHGWLPRVDAIFLAGSLPHVAAATACAAVLFLLAHESAHLTAAWSVGVPARWRVSTRLDSVVAETEAPAMWSRSRRQRMRFYLAGIRSDITLGASALLMQGLATSPAWTRALQLAVLVACGMLLFQMQVFLRTDLYYVLMDALKAPNLNADALAWLRSLAWRRRPQRRQAAVAGVVRAYALLQVVAGAALAVAFASLLPTALRLWRRSAEHVRLGISNHDAALLVDGAVPLALETASVALLVYVVVRDRRRRRAQPQRAQGANRGPE